MEYSNENEILLIKDSAAKQAKKKRDELVLYVAIAIACSVTPIAFLIYFCINFSLVGVISFGVTFVAATTVTVILIVKNRETIDDCKRTVQTYLTQKDDPKALTPPALDLFCMTAVKVMFVVLSAVILCAIPSLITMCANKTFTEIFGYIGQCLGTFWGMNKNPDFFTYIIGTGLMAGIFGLLLLIIRFFGKLLK